MAYIFLDESGDLGFDFGKKGTTKFFIVTFLFVPGGKRPLEKIVSRIHDGLKRGLSRRIGVLHAAHEKSTTKQRLLKRIAGKDFLIMAIYLNKQKVQTKLQDEKQVLYNYVTNILLDRIFVRKIIPTNMNIELVASRRETNKFLNENFKDYLNRQAKHRHRTSLHVSIKTPVEEKGLQAADFISWAIFRKYERGDDTYYNIVKERIVEESPLFP